MPARTVLVRRVKEVVDAVRLEEAAVNCYCDG